MSKLMTGVAVAAILTISAAAQAATPKTTPPTAPPPTTSTPPTDAAPPATPAPDPAAPPPATTDQTPSAPSAPATTPAAPTGTATDTTAVVAVGLSVKDNTGSQIGQITAINKDATGKDMATVQMGADVFSVDASRLAVASGAATINLTKQQITDMLPKKAPPAK